MWKPPLNFITIHYAWIIACTLTGILVLLPAGNVSAIDSWFFGCSAATESGLNPIDVNKLQIYQQVFIYIVPTITNPGFINIVVVAVRLHWFNKLLKDKGPDLLRQEAHADGDVEAQRRPRSPARLASDNSPGTPAAGKGHGDDNNEKPPSSSSEEAKPVDDPAHDETPDAPSPRRQRGILFAPDVKGAPDPNGKALYIPSPRDRDRGYPIIERDMSAQNDARSEIYYEEEDNSNAKPSVYRSFTAPMPVLAGPSRRPSSTGSTHRRPFSSHSHIGPSLNAALSVGRVERVASNMFVLGRGHSHGRPGLHRGDFSSASVARSADLPFLSREVTMGRNSRFLNLSHEDRDRLGGVEYRALTILLRIVVGFFFGLNILGVICLLPWIHHAPGKYVDWLAECGIDRTWWAFYSSQTMSNNLGFTLTPDSMITFRDATWPMLVMTFLAFAGNTLYPVFLRLLIWIMWVASPRSSSLRDPLRFLLDHPRRCYTLLFPGKTTWILFGIVFVLNFVDVLLIILLDLHNPVVNELAPGPRILAALFQAASARHTGTATFNLSQVSPAVQFSLVVMMYISILPIAITIRSSNTYEERALGMYETEKPIDENDGSSYVMMHVRNQLSFDLWYIFLGTFLICIAEADRIADMNDPGFSVFAAFFEVVSAYGNVGLSLGHPSVATSFSGVLTTFSKVVICLMVIRGRHRGLPYSLDKAIMLPSQKRAEDGRKIGASGDDADDAHHMPMSPMSAMTTGLGMSRMQSMVRERRTGEKAGARDDV